MPRSVVLRVALLGASLALAACSGATSADPSGPGAGSAAPSTPASAPASAAASTDQASAAPSAGTSTGAGGAAAACDLLTIEEAGGAVGQTIVDAVSTPGDPSYCQYADSSGQWHVALSYDADAEPFAWDIWAQEDGAVGLDIPGVEAVFSPSTDTVFIHKGSAIAGIIAGVGGGVTPTEQRQAWATELAAIAATRM